MARQSVQDKQKPRQSKVKGKAKGKGKGGAKHPSRSWRMRALWWILKWSAILGIWACVTLAVMLAYYSADLPDISEIGLPKSRPSITIQSEDGTAIANYGQTFGEYISFDEMPTHLIEAILATEDRRFFYHSGMDSMGILRAMFANVRAGHIVQGGSTITQQLAKNLFLSPERTLKRKVQELLIAFELERRFTKQEILALYLNRVYLGAGTYGIDAASNRYFNKPIQEVNLSEAAMIAGLLKAPSRYSPASNKELSQKRATQVLENMVDAGVISRIRADDAKAHPAKVRTITDDSRNAYYFADWIAEQIPNFITNLQEDILVKTTLNASLQQMADKAVVRVLDTEGKKRNADQAAFLAMTPDGAIRAMVGGRNYVESQFNRVTQARRQPGSAFKMFVYGAALEMGYTPYDVEDDAPLVIGKWKPENYTQGYAGQVTLQTAFARSLNTVAVRVSESIGRWRVINFAKKLGVRSPLGDEPSLALGTSEMSPMELTTAYAHIAALGHQVVPFGILEIRSRQGELLYQHVPEESVEVVDTHTTMMLTGMMQETVEQGTAKRARIGRPVAGKTGTSQNYRDAWFVGFTPDIVAGVWIGNDDNSPTKGVTGGSLPAAIWHDVMAQYLEHVPVSGFGRRVVAGGQLIPWESQESGGGRMDSSMWNQFLDHLKNTLNSEGAGENRGSQGRESDIEYSYPKPSRN